MKSRLLIAALWLAAGAAIAQERPPLEPIPEPPPPPPGVDDVGVEPEVTIIKRGEDTVEEYRINGRLYAMKITPRFGKPYYVVDHKGDGVFQRYEIGGDFKAPQWLIKSW